MSPVLRFCKVIQMTNIYTSSVNTLIGKLYLAATEKGLTHVTLPSTTREEFETSLKADFPNSTIQKENSLLKQTATQLEQYFKGELSTFSIQLDIQGTDFHKKVLRKVSQIKYGQTKTYGQIALEAGSPKAYRAVGSANAKNKIPIIIPCHRVVASNSLGGYAGGLKLKEKILSIEKNNSQINK